MADKYASREDCEEAHTAITEEFKEVHSKLDYITGKIDGMTEQKGSDWQTFGVVGAIAMALWNLFTK